MKISLIHPSRGRAVKAKATLDYWMQRASGEHEIEHIISIDADDDPIQLQTYKELFFTGSTVLINDNTCMVDAANHAAKKARGHIMVYFSEDFLCPQNWDYLIADLLELHIPNPRLLKVDDCLQKFDVPVLTIPIMNRWLYNKLGYFWHPGYKSMFVDEDLYWTCKNNGWLLNYEALKFPHEHCSIGKAERDETYIRSERNWDQGKALYAERKAANFPLS
jgi:hypothetical protein